MKTIQYFSQDYLEHCKKLTPDDIALFLENFRLLQRPDQRAKRKLISIRIPENLLEAFKHKAKIENTLYQRKIVELMEAWI